MEGLLHLSLPGKFLCSMQKSWRSTNKVELKYLVKDDVALGPEAAHSLSSHLGLALAYMTLSEEKLTVQVARLDGVHVDLHARPAKRASQGLYWERSTASRRVHKG